MHSEQGVTRRTLIQGSAGALVGGMAAVALARFGTQNASAQEATPAATDLSVYPELVIVGKEYVFTGPAEVAGGLTRVTLQNEGTMDHHAMLIRFNDGKSMADLPGAMASGLAGLFAIGTSVGGPGSIGPGQKSTVIVDLAEGNYVVLCVIPDDDGIPHAAKGMIMPLTVTAAATAAAPTAGGAIELMDFHFQGLPATVPAGEQVWSVTNTGAQLHELVIYQQAPGVTFEQVTAILMAPPEASPTAEMAEMAASPAAAMGAPFTAISGVAPISPGLANWLVADLAAGDYFAICFIPDAATGAPHFALGMIQPFTVS